MGIRTTAAVTSAAFAKKLGRSVDMSGCLLAGVVPALENRYEAGKWKVSLKFGRMEKVGAFQSKQNRSTIYRAPTER
jgi:hypothetical protein